MKLRSTITKKNTVIHKWHLIDLSGQTLGRACVKIAHILMGKDKPSFSFQRDDGDYVIAINTDKIVVTGKKLTDKIYYHHTAFAGHLKEMSLKDMMSKDSRQVIMHGVNGMLSKNKQRDRRLARLKLFTGSEHPYGDKIK
ncbi:50S ribosomal protein L13 [Candidatus Shapirobacteria bacterium CG10_big_fil_rev_8_21_14_0_10_36_6]|uniref:Large ribosomal subunit protein uL13 n=1 Tax=Candidatus Shapirobacteria bacterium CG10_big_fil_rev_8_21_14_0_10_36_6 TaxID=1974886 RepID=A0A2M8L158_9BACT|nr:MAG: 50S ribosomal protein L13 [Candidatus Shapirobacteria bacterium CG10_big_fil_rev_8_21_14_0_10_36_6]